MQTDNTDPDMDVASPRFLKPVADGRLNTASVTPGRQNASRENQH